MALTQDELGNWYDDGATDSYDFGGSGYGFDTNKFYDYNYVADNYTPTYDPNFVSPYLDNPEFFGSLPGTEGSTSVADSSGNITYKYDDGSTLTVGPNGLPISNTESPDSKGNSVAFNRALAWTSQNLGGTAAKVLQNVMKNPGASLMTALAAAKAFGGSDKDGGYNKPVPKMDVIAERPVYDDTNRRPGEAGRRYFTNPLFVAQGDTENMQKAQTATMEQKSGLQAAAPQYAAPAPNPYAGKIPTGFSTQQTPVAPVAAAGLPAIPTREQIDMQNQQRAPMQMARGGIADAGRYLQGKTDGMADEIETSIDGEQPALLSHGEFVIPADVVSHLGNGNSEAGAEKLYSMMDRIREARTGTKEQGKEINADKFLAAASGGLAAAYAGGGEVQKFVTGGMPNTPTPTATGAGGVPLDVSRSSTLSPWVGDYVTNALGQGAALASAPYQAYQGPLTAGASNLQQQAFAGASDIASAGYTPGSFVGGFGSTQAAQYMNPYIQASLDPQLAELKRQSDIARLDDAGRLTRAGAFGGSRQAIMESEGRRNLLDKQANLIGQGYKTAFDTGASRFAADQAAQERSRQFGADFGLQSVKGLADLGAVQRGITSEGLAADRAQFQEERDFAYKMPQYQLGLLSGLPIGSNTTAVNQDAISRAASTVGGLGSLYDMLAGLGQAPKK
jgi:hypothetical protein